MRWRRSALGLLSLLAGLLLASAPAWADFPVVAAKSSGHTGVATTDHVLTLPSGIASGHLLVCGLAISQSSTTSWPSGWTALVADTNHPNGTFSYRIYRRVADGTEGSSITVTTSSSLRDSWICLRITGQHASTAPEAATPATGNGTQPDPPALDPTGWDTEDTLWLAFSLTNLGTTDHLQFPAGYTDGTEVNDNSGSGTATAYAHRQAAAASENPPAFLLDATDDWAAITVAVRPAVAGGGGGGGAGAGRWLPGLFRGGRL